jgi:hypothetical protein
MKTITKKGLSLIWVRWMEGVQMKKRSPLRESTMTRTDMAWRVCLSREKCLDKCPTTSLEMRLTLRENCRRTLRGSSL